MIVDTSALAAILFGEPERDAFADLILQTPTSATSTPGPWRAGKT